MASVAATVYLYEVSTPRKRHTVAMLVPISLLTGVFLSQMLTLLFNTNTLWRISFAFPIILALVQVAMLPTCVQSPRFLILNGRFEAAQKVLSRLRSNPEVETEWGTLVDSCLYSQVQGHNDVSSRRARSNAAGGDFQETGGDAAKRGGSVAAAAAYTNTAECDGDNNIDSRQPGQLTPTQRPKGLLAVFKKSILPELRRVVLYIAAMMLWMPWTGGLLQLAFSGRYMADRLGEGQVIPTRWLAMALSLVALLACSVVVVITVAFSLGVLPMPWLSIAEMLPGYVVVSATSIANAGFW
ncbi:Bifunctional purine biosynthesis protein PurH, partial [Spiromyces aspiralis]